MSAEPKNVAFDYVYALASGKVLKIDTCGRHWIDDVCISMTPSYPVDYENPDCYYNPETGELAVLYCPNVGRGWSTQKNGYDILATDKKLVQMVLNEEPYSAAVKRLEELGMEMSDHDVRVIYQSLRIEYIPRGEWYFIQRSHIGSEYIIRQCTMKQS